MVLLGLLQSGGSVLGQAMEQVTGGNLLSTLLIACAFTLSLVYLFRLAVGHMVQLPAGAKSPPYIFSPIPFLGHAIAFGKSPIEFLENAYEKYGPVFSFTMVGKTFTYLLGSDAAALLFNSKNEDLNAEDVYSRLTTPVFGKGVAYDVPNAHSKQIIWRACSKRRDRAHREIKNIFYKAIKKRRQSEEKVDDILQTLLDSTYKDKPLQEKCFLEQKAVCGEDLPPLTYEQLKDLNLLDRCIKETLRLRPPIMTMMRMARTPQTVAGYTIPPGHQVCVSPTVNQRLKDSWVERLDFNPDRYLQDNPASGEKFAYVPFGAGRHRCIGENFAYVQIKTIWSTMLRLYEFDLINGYFPSVNYTTMIHTPENPVIRYKRRSK
ncbi:lanosterol 14-alpha demethylase-like protein [Cricetulus griseus]|uniref:Lanosterol 14-alpha demethylase n=1 Tax=Cricetulus griseus TaxID=10029 RepID=A0A061IMH9_CRIGR|nr:lanosterol 14-alpha demethylase-like protein [Cricetulus griseus]